MTLTRRSFLSITAVAAALTAAVVYGSDSGGASSASGNNLIIWADQKKADSLTEFAKKWGEQQGITVTVQTVANDLQSNFITANQAGNGPDVVLGAHDWIGNLVQNGSILPIALSAEPGPTTPTSRSGPSPTRARPTRPPTPWSACPSSSTRT